MSNMDWKWGRESCRSIGLHTLDLALDLRLDKWEDVLVQARADLDQPFPVNAQTTLV